MHDNIQSTPARHPRYYGSGHLTFAVDGYLFQLPVRRLQLSKYFQDLLGSEHLGASIEGRSDERPIILEGITSFEMESFSDILEARVFDQDEGREWKQLAAALPLATIWDFEQVRAKLIKDMSQLISNGGVGPLDRVEVSIRCGVSDWLHPAYQELCDRTEGVTTEEAKRLGMDRLAAIYRIRDRLKHPYSPETPSGRCAYCVGTGYANRVPRAATLDLIKAEEILSSVEGPINLFGISTQ